MSIESSISAFSSKVQFTALMIASCNLSRAYLPQDRGKCDGCPQGECARSDAGHTSNAATAPEGEQETGKSSTFCFALSNAAPRATHPNLCRIISEGGVAA